MIPEEKLVELLEKHLEVSKETAEKIISDIKEKLIPYIKIINIEEKEATPEPSTQEIILEKIRNNTPAQQIAPLPLEKVKNIEVKSVEENAEKLKNLGESRQDTYRESLE